MNANSDDDDNPSHTAREQLQVEGSLDPAALAMTFAAMNLLAFGLHTVCDCLEELWQAARDAKGSRRRFFEHIRTLSAYLVFPSWRVFMETPIASKPPDLEKAI